MQSCKVVGPNGVRPKASAAGPYKFALRLRRTALQFRKFFFLASFFPAVRSSRMNEVFVPCKGTI